MDIQNKKIGQAEFEALRREVLAQWPTGKDVDLQEAVAYHKAMPASRNFSQKLVDAKRAGRTLIQPRAGVPVIEEHIKLMQYLEQHGEADLLPSTIDSYTRQNRYEEAENGIAASIKEGRALMNKGDYVAARELFLSLDGYGASKALADNCTLALNKAAYSEADKLEESGDLLGAMEAFTALGEALDAAERAADCRAAIHAELDAQYAAVTLATAPNLMDAYAALEDDEIAAARTTELTARFGKNLELITMSGAYVELGAYPQAESGAEQPVRWAVIKREGAVLTLLSVNVLDASAEAMAPAIVFNEAEAAAVSEVQLPSVADLALLNDRTAAATAYALAQGVASEEGATSFWLRDSLENGMHPVIAPSGTLSLPAEGAVYGLRPLITLNLDSFSFASGSGTENDPFRAE